jgi:hypothetical protein
LASRQTTPWLIRVRTAWALIETLYAGHPDWLRAIRAADCDPLDDWAVSHRARLLADLTELGGRPSSDVTNYDELRELAYMVATMTDEQEQLAALERFPLGLNRDSQGGRKGGVLGG